MSSMSPHRNLTCPDIGEKGAKVNIMTALLELRKERERIADEILALERLAKGRKRCVRPVSIDAKKKKPKKRAPFRMSQ
jgi:hypothetical protein